MYDLPTQKLIVTLNVLFTEDNFPLKPGKEIDTLNILEKGAIHSDKSTDIFSTTKASFHNDYEWKKRVPKKGGRPFE